MDHGFARCGGPPSWRSGSGRSRRERPSRLTTRARPSWASRRWCRAASSSRTSTRAAPGSGSSTTPASRPAEQDYRPGGQPPICATNVISMDKMVDGSVYPPGSNPKSYYVCQCHAGEWVSMTIDVQQAGRYRVSTTFATNAGTIEIDLSSNGVDKSGSVKAAGTSDYHVLEEVRRAHDDRSRRRAAGAALHGRPGWPAARLFAPRARGLRAGASLVRSTPRRTTTARAPGRAGPPAARAEEASAPAALPALVQGAAGASGPGGAAGTGGDAAGTAGGGGTTTAGAAGTAGRAPAAPRAGQGPHRRTRPLTEGRVAPSGAARAPRRRRPSSSSSWPPPRDAAVTVAEATSLARRR